MGISKSSWCTKYMRGNTGHETSNWVQPKASFKCKVSYGAGGRRSREDVRLVTAVQTQGVRNHCVHWWSNLGQLPAWQRVSEWVSDVVLELGQAEPFVPAAATFQSSTDIYTPGLIERLACEPPACTHTPTSPSMHAHIHPHAETDTLRTALPPKTPPALTHRRERPDALHLW